MVLSSSSISSRPRTGWIIRARSILQMAFFPNSPGDYSVQQSLYNHRLRLIHSFYYHRPNTTQIDCTRPPQNRQDTRKHHDRHDTHFLTRHRVG